MPCELLTSRIPRSGLFITGDALGTSLQVTRFASFFRYRPLEASVVCNLLDRGFMECPCNIRIVFVSHLIYLHLQPLSPIQYLIDLTGVGKPDDIKCPESSSLEGGAVKDECSEK